MAASIHKAHARIALSYALCGLISATSALALAAVSPSATATRPASAQLPISLDAQSSEFDYQNNNLVFRKVRISQGSMSVAADQAQATGLDFDNSHWVFRGNVKITLDQGQLTSDEAQVSFAKKLLAQAVISGKPAQFEQHNSKTGRQAHGSAELIEYDVAKGVVVLSKDAFLSDGQNDIHGESLKYNILNQSVIADASDQGSGRVHITIAPPAATKP